MCEVELYARGLALAEGHRSSKTGLRYHMSAEAKGVLDRIGSVCGSKNGSTKGYLGAFKLTLSGKGWWKDSVEGLDSVHAFRGYVEGDGCWTSTPGYYTYKSHRKELRYRYPALIIFVAEREQYLCKWVEGCLEGFKYFVQVVPTRLGTSTLTKYYVKGKECVRLYNKLYEGATIHFKSGRLVGLKIDKRPEDCYIASEDLKKEGA